MPKSKRSPIDYTPQFGGGIFRPQDVVERELAASEESQAGLVVETETEERQGGSGRTVATSTRSRKLTERSDESTNVRTNERTKQRSNERTFERKSVTPLIFIKTNSYRFVNSHSNVKQSMGNEHCSATLCRKHLTFSSPKNGIKNNERSNVGTKQRSNVGTND